MTILHMRASFGCLQNAELTLAPGLNVLTLPNESGKSTWAQFLLAMFYGVDTGERAKAGSIPAKTKYKPWSGAPMAGEIELDWEGRIIILERTSRGRTPMGQFRAYEKDSGVPVPELTAENCGRVLLGVERSVFERSAFVRQLGLAVSADDALEKRLASLVTTGEETVSAAETARRLRDRKNRLRHNKTGLIPEANAQLAAVEASLAQHQLAAQQQQTLRARQQELAVRRAELLDIQAGLTILDNQKKLQQKTNAKAALIDANNRLAGAQARRAKRWRKCRRASVPSRPWTFRPHRPNPAPRRTARRRSAASRRSGCWNRPRAMAASSTGSPRSAAVLSFWTCWPSYFLRQPP